MAQRKSWTKSEDNLLITLRLERGVQKWCDIAEILRVEYGIEGRNGKQCRERFHNHLDSSITKAEWTPEEDLKLISLHNQMGNRWAQIARQIAGRTDNCVKNRFYTKFRRSIRLINECIKKFWKKQFKTLKQSIISKIIQFSEKNCPLSKNKQNVFKTCEDLKIRLFAINEEKLEEVEKNGTQLQLAELLKDICQFNKDNRRRGKKKKVTNCNRSQEFQCQIKLQDSLKIQNELDSDEEGRKSCSADLSQKGQQKQNDRNDMALEEEEMKDLEKMNLEEYREFEYAPQQGGYRSPFGGLSDLSGIGSPTINQKFLQLEQNFLQIKQVDSEQQDQRSAWRDCGEFDFHL